jgi:hypothetical protein
MNDQRVGPGSDDVAQREDVGLADRLLREEFAEEGAMQLPALPARSRSHRVGMLAGLGVVGVLLAVLLIVAPG